VIAASLAGPLVIPAVIAAVVILALLVGDAKASIESSGADDDFWNGI
jgi:hypothetical protein